MASSRASVTNGRHLCRRHEDLAGLAQVDLDLANHHSIRLRIAVKPDAKHPGGINIFGRGFGNYDQEIVMRIADGAV
jgi:predicted transcriptional regulator